MSTVTLRELALSDMPAAARVHRASFDARLPALTGLHTPEEDLDYWRDHLFPECQIFGVEREGTLLGVIAFRRDWIDQLYILPAAQGQGI